MLIDVSLPFLRNSPVTLAPIRFIRPFSALVTFSMSFHGVAQQVRVIDDQTGQPVRAAEVFGSDRSRMSTTDVNGKFGLESLRGSDSLYFRHVVYEDLVLPFTEVEARGEVRLVVRSYPIAEFVVSANRWELDEQRIPDRITVLRPRDIALQNPGTSADLLEQSGEIFVQRSQQAGGSPMLRGFAANRVLIVVDGVRMNNAIYRSGNLQNVISVDPNAVENAEVVHGPGAMTYGSDAIGGIMDFHLLRPRTAPDSSLLVHGGALLRYATASQESTGHVHLGVGGRKMAFVGSASFSRFGDLRMGVHGLDDYLRPWYVDQVEGVDSMFVNPDPLVQVGSSFDNMAFMGKLLYALHEDLRIGVNGYWSTTSDYDRYDQMREEQDGEARFAEWYYGPQDWRMLSLVMDHHAERGPYSQAHFSVAYQNYSESRTDRRFRRSERRIREEQVNGLWMNLDLVKDLGERTQLLYGTEYVTNRVGSEGVVRDLITDDQQVINPRYPDGSHWNTASVYAGGLHDLSRSLTLSAGLRGNWSALEAAFDTTLFPYPVTSIKLDNSSVTGNLGLAWRPSSWRFTLDLSTGFRAPNIDDIGKVFSNEPGTVIAPNPDLGPEYAYNFELGVEKRFHERVRLRLNGFHVLVDEIMVRRPFQVNGQDSILVDGERSRTDALQNAAQARVWGVLAALEARLTNGLGLDLRYSWQVGSEDDAESGQDLPLRHLPPSFGSVALTWERGRWRLRSVLRLSEGFDPDQLAPTEKDKTSIYARNDDGEPFLPGWHCWDVRAAFRLTDTFQITGGVENITDQRYRTYSSGITAPGRNFILAVNARF
ncbi:MAG: TonB-dependent receptor [Flavobacteriales bacterium]|nr:TonB-dependent receptor [Flavobacteriales bacterium]